MAGFRRVAAAGFADAPPTAAELAAQKARAPPSLSLSVALTAAPVQAASQLAELRRLREAAAEMLRRRDDDTDR